MSSEVPRKIMELTGVPLLLIGQLKKHPYMAREFLTICQKRGLQTSELIPTVIDMIIGLPHKKSADAAIIILYFNLFVDRSSPLYLKFSDSQHLFKGYQLPEWFEETSANIALNANIIATVCELDLKFKELEKKVEQLDPKYVPYGVLLHEKDVIVKDAIGSIMIDNFIKMNQFTLDNLDAEIYSTTSRKILIDIYNNRFTLNKLTDNGEKKALGPHTQSSVLYNTVKQFIRESGLKPIDLYEYRETGFTQLPFIKDYEDNFLKLQIGLPQIWSQSLVYLPLHNHASRLRSRMNAKKKKMKDK
jgi:hypothetical protein